MICGPAGCVGGSCGGAPTKAQPNACNAALANSKANAVASASVQKLLNAIAAKGIRFQVVDTTLPAGTAARATVNYNSGGMSTVQWDAAQVAIAVANGQSAEQILFMELEHIYLGAMGPAGSGGRAMSILGGQPADTFTVGTTSYTLDPSGNASAGVTQIGAQYPADQHLRIHDDIVSIFGEDKTGALAEAIGKPANDKDVRADSKTKLATGTSGLVLADACAPFKAASSLVRNAKSVDDGSEIPSPATLVFDANY